MEQGGVWGKVEVGLGGGWGVRVRVEIGGGGEGEGKLRTPSTAFRHLPPNSKHWFTSFLWRKVPESDTRSVG